MVSLIESGIVILTSKVPCSSHIYQVLQGKSQHSGVPTWAGTSVHRGPGGSRGVPRGKDDYPTPSLCQGTLTENHLKNVPRPTHYYTLTVPWVTLLHPYCAMGQRHWLQPFWDRIYHCHLHPLQAANCCRNYRLVVDEDYDLMHQSFNG